MTTPASASEARSARTQLKWLVWRIRHRTSKRELIAAFADHNYASAYGEQEIQGDFTDYEVTDLEGKS